MKHGFERMSLCLYCGSWCPFCNQCRCETDARFTCPNFDTKKQPGAFADWKRKRKEDREAKRLTYAAPFEHSFDSVWEQDLLVCVAVDGVPRSRWIGNQMVFDIARSAR